MTKRTAFITSAGLGGVVLLAGFGATAALRNPGFSELSDGRGGINVESLAYTHEMGFDKKRSVEAFKATVYPLLRARCSACHSTENKTGAQAPLHADVDVNLAHDYALTRVNFREPESSRPKFPAVGGSLYRKRRRSTVSRESHLESAQRIAGISAFRRLESARRGSIYQHCSRIRGSSDTWLQRYVADRTGDKLSGLGTSGAIVDHLRSPDGGRNRRVGAVYCKTTEQQMSEEESGEITLLLQKWRDGDREAENALFSRVFPNLRRLAHYMMKRERPGHSLQPTELVDQIYLRLVAAKNRDWRNRRHFFAIAARAMRRHLIDHARGRPSAEVLGLDGIREFLPAASVKLDQAIVVDRLLNQLAAMKPEWCELVELKYFLGLSDEETAETLGMKLRTMQRMWSDARQWLFEHTDSRGAEHDAGR